MVTVGTQGTVVSGVNATLTLNGNLYAAVRSFSAKWGNKIEEEKVSGTDIPIINTAEYHGEMEMEAIYSTENTAANEQFTKLLTPSNGQISALNLIWVGKDVQGNARTFTLSGSFWPQQTQWDMVGPSVVKAKISGVFTARPILT